MQIAVDQYFFFHYSKIINYNLKPTESGTFEPKVEQQQQQQ